MLKYLALLIYIYNILNNFFPGVNFIKNKKIRKKNLRISKENRKLGSPVNLHVKLLLTEAGGLKLLFVRYCLYRTLIDYKCSRII